MNVKIHILMIEDDKSICAYIAALLNKAGYRATAAANGKEGLSLAASLCPDLILLDLWLPDMDGFEVLRQLREGYASPSSLSLPAMKSSKRYKPWIWVPTTMSPNLSIPMS